jgi:EmrB/QacA subfamily drug resistance transporter
MEHDMSETALAPGAAQTARAQTSPWAIFWIACIAVFLVSLDGTVLFAAFGALRQAFPQATAAEMSWVLNAYTVVFAAMLIPAGGLADIHGRKRLFLIGVALFLVASTACGAAGNVAFLIVARALQATGAALLMPASLSIVLDAFPKEKRAVVVSIWGAVGGLAAALGPSLGTFLVDKMGWPWAFYINLPLGAISLWRGATRLREFKGTPKTPRVDWVGVSLVIIAVGGAAMAITQSDSPHWSRADLWATGVAAAIALTAFIAWARTARHPHVDLSLFQNPTYSAVNLATLTFGTAFAMMFFAFFAYMTAVWHYSLPVAGIAITPGPLLVIPTAVITGRLAARIGHRPVLVTGSVLYAASGLWLLLVPGSTPAYVTDWLPGLVMSGIGVGMVMPSLSGAAVAGLPAEHYAVGSAVNQSVRQIGSVLGVAVTVVFIGHDGLAKGDFSPLYGLHIGLALMTGLLCLVVNTQPRQLSRIR